MQAKWELIESTLDKWLFSVLLYWLSMEFPLIDLLFAARQVKPV